MIGYGDRLVEAALNKGFELILADPDPVGALARLAPSPLGDLRRKWAARLISQTVRVKSGFITGLDAPLAPTMSVVMEAHQQTADLLSQGERFDPVTKETIGWDPSVASVRIFIYGQHVEDIRLLTYFARSAVRTLAKWWARTVGVGGSIDTFKWVKTEDLVPDKAIIPDGVTVYATAMTFHLSSVEPVKHIGVYDGTLVEFLSVAEQGVSVDAEPNPETRAFVPYGSTVVGGITPEEA